MQSKILYELYNMTVSGGTGIATYARNLCSIAPELGFDAEGLVHTWRPIDRKDPVLAEVGFYDARNRPEEGLRQKLRIGLHAIVGDPLGITGAPLPTRSVVVPGGAGREFSGLNQVFAAPLFADRARLHFKRYGRAAALNVSSKPDIFHATQPIPLRVSGAINIYTIHDIIPLRLPYSTLDNKKVFLNLVRYLGRTADRIVTVSETSRNDLIEICGLSPEKVVNTYQTVSFPPKMLAPSDDEAARLVESVFNLGAREYYLFYGALEPKKNVGRLVDAFVASGTRRSLILAGGLGWDYEGDLRKIGAAQDKALRVQGRRIMPDERVRRFEFLPLFQLVALIRCARAVIFPSLYEGFGLPVVESMLLGTPVITSNVSSLAEVAGSAALLVDPLDVQNIAAAIARIERDEALCAELSARGRSQAARFSRDAYKARLARVYEEAFDRKTARSTWTGAYGGWRHAHQGSK